MRDLNLFRSSRSLAGFLVLFSLLVFIGCQKNQELSDEAVEVQQEAQQMDETTEDLITLLISPWPPDAINYLAQEKGFFEKHGANVKLLWADGYEDTFSQFESGDLDVVNTTLLDVVNYHAETGRGVAFFIEDYSAGADALVSLEAIESVSDLDGKVVGAEQGTVGEFFLQILLEREGLSLEDLEIVDTASEEVVNALKEGVIDAGVCYEPCPSDAVDAGGFVVLDSAKERDLIVDAYMGKQEDLEARKDEYVKVLHGLIDAGEYFNENPKESAEIMAEVLNMSGEQVLDVFSGLRIPDFRDNQAAFNRTSGFSSLYNLAKLASQYLEDQNLIDESFDTDLVIYPDIVETINR